MKSQVKEKIVLLGKSKVFEDWNINSGITQEDFLTHLEWLHEDPADGSTGGGIGQLTRELGCDPKRGLVRIKRVYDHTGWVTMREIESNQLWDKSKPSISARDRI